MNLKYRNNIKSIIKTIIKYFKKYVLHIFFSIALYLSIKWSEIPLFKVTVKPQTAPEARRLRWIAQQ